MCYRKWMVLSGLSSNRSFTSLTDYLTAITKDQGREPSQNRGRPRHAGWPDGRRAFGSVSKAILTVLGEADTEMAVKAIYAEVERILEGTVSRHSVSDYLLTRAKEPNPLFVRTRHGHYQLLRSDSGRAADTSTRASTQTGE